MGLGCYLNVIWSFKLNLYHLLFSFKAQANKIHREMEVTLFAQNSHFFQLSM